MLSLLFVSVDNGMSYKPVLAEYSVGCSTPSEVVDTCNLRGAEEMWLRAISCVLYTCCQGYPCTSGAVYTLMCH